MLLFFFALTSAEYDPNILIDAQTDLLIKRLSTVYNIKLPEGYYSQPINYQAINTFFKIADSLNSLGILSKTESFLLKKAEWRTGYGRSLLKWSDENHNIHLKANLNLLGDLYSGANDSTTLRMKGIISPSFAGNVGKLSFYSGLDIWTEYMSDSLFKRSSYQPYDGIAYNVYGRNTDTTNIRSSDIPRGGIRYDAGRIRLETVIDYLKYGPAVYFPLTLSGTTPPITYAKGVIDMGAVTYTHIAGQLKSQKDKSKYIYSHRLDISSWKSRLQIGINEVIINGSTTDQNLGDSNRISTERTDQVRSWEWVYLIPFVPFKFVEHYAGDRDNAALSFDLNLHYPQKFRWYGEFFLDDMLNPWQIFSNDWGNKWAATIGLQIFGSLLLRDITFTAEYSHVEPWVYTHFFGGSHNYAHFGQSLGSPLGPNSQAIVLSTIMQINKLNSFEIIFRNIAKNSSYRGGNITDIFQEDGISTHFQDSEKKEFLGPGTVWSFQPGIRWYLNSFGIYNAIIENTFDFTDRNFTNRFAILGGLRF